MKSEKKISKILDYEQVKARVNKESEILPCLVTETGIGMIVVAIVKAIIVFC